MLKIRLMRIGKKNAPAYRLVVAEKTAPIKGKFLEVLGSYNPRLKVLNIKKERIQHWLSKGAQASDTVYNLLVSQGVIKGPKIKKKIKTKAKKEEPKEEIKTKVKDDKETIKEEPKKEKTAAKKETDEEPKEEKPQKEAKAEKEKADKSKEAEKPQAGQAKPKTIDKK